MNGPTNVVRRILIVSQHFWPALGGAEVMLRRLAAEWAGSGREVTVLAERDDPAWPVVETLDGFRIVRTPRWRMRFLGTLRHIANTRRFLAATAGQFDVVYASMLKHAAYACLTAKGLTTPVVLRAEGAGSTGDAAWQDRALFGRRIASACRAAPAVVAPSAAIVEELAERGYDRGRLHHIPNGVPIPARPWSYAEVSPHRQALGLPDMPTVAYTGRLHVDKGLKDLILALAGSSRLQLVLVGDGPERQALEALARQLNLVDQVRFAGRVPDVEPWLRAADLFVLPSYQEGLSVALLEALALGMPTIASDIPGNRGVLPPHLLPSFPIQDPAALRDALRNALGNLAPERLSQRIRRETSERYSLQSIARRHLELFQALR